MIFSDQCFSEVAEACRVRQALNLRFIFEWKMQDFWLLFSIQVESDPRCQMVLKARMSEGSLPECNIISDVVGYKPSGPAADAQFVTAGFPCQAATPVAAFHIIHLLCRKRNTIDKYIAEK